MRQLTLNNLLKLTSISLLLLALSGCQSSGDAKPDPNRPVPVSAMMCGSTLIAAKNAIYGACTNLGFKLIATNDLIVCEQMTLSENRERELVRGLGEQIQGLDNSYTLKPRSLVSFAVTSNGADVNVVANAYATIQDLGEIPRQLNLHDETSLQQVQALLRAAGAK